MFPAGYYYGGGLIGQVGPANAIILQPELDLHPTTTLGIYLKRALRLAGRHGRRFV
jgi:hypothetical protein